MISARWSEIGILISSRRSGRRVKYIYGKSTVYPWLFKYMVGRYMISAQWSEIGVLIASRHLVISRPVEFRLKISIQPHTN